MVAVTLFHTMPIFFSFVKETANIVLWGKTKTKTNFSLPNPVGRLGPLGPDWDGDLGLFASLSPLTSLSACSWRRPFYGSFNMQQVFSKSCGTDGRNGRSPTPPALEPSLLSLPYFLLSLPLPLLLPPSLLLPL